MSTRKKSKGCCKVNIELTNAEMVALGYAISSGIKKAEAENNKNMRRLLKDLCSVFVKVWMNNEEEFAKKLKERCL
jgi:hypothetical protein